MPVQMTYNTLQDWIKTYTDRGYGPVTDPIFYAQIPGLIYLAQDRLSKEDKTLISRIVVQETLTVGQPIVQKPVGWRNSESFLIMTGPTFNKAKPIFLKTLNYCQIFWPDPTIFGEPKYYADYDIEHWVIVPTPDRAYPVESKIEVIVNPIDENNQVNFFTKYAPQLLLHACLLEAGIFLKNADMIAREQAYYDRLLQGETFQDQARETDKSETIGF